MFLHFLVVAQRFIPDEEGNLTALMDKVPSEETLPSTSSGDIGYAFVKMILTFFALILLFFATYWFLRKWIHRRLRKGIGQERIQILEKQMLSPKTMLYLVELENKKILIAESHLEVRKIESVSLSKESAAPERGK